MGTRVHRISKYELFHGPDPEFDRPSKTEQLLFYDCFCDFSPLAPSPSKGKVSFLRIACLSLTTDKNFVQQTLRKLNSLQLLFWCQEA